MMFIWTSPYQWSAASLPPGTHFTKSLWAHNWNLVKIYFTLILILMIQSGHKFADVTTAKLSWHLQICDLISLLFSMEKQKLYLYKIWILS